MRNPIKALVGTPENHQEEKEKNEVVKAPEFDLTLYAKRLAVVIPVVAAACVGVAEIKTDVSEVIKVAIFGVVAAALLGSSLAMAADLLARGYVTGAGSRKAAESEPAEAGDSAVPTAGSSFVAAPPGTLVWIEGASGPHPVLAVATDGDGASSYLVADGSSLPRPNGERSVDSITGAPNWHTADKIEAIKPPKWP